MNGLIHIQLLVSDDHGGHGDSHSHCIGHGSQEKLCRVQ